MTTKRSLQFSVQDALGDVHHVVIEQDAANTINLTAHCSCSEANDAGLCVHRLEILSGDAHGVVAANSADLETLARWIAGSDIEAAMKELARAKSDVRLAMEKVEYARAMLAKRMLD